MVAGQPAQTAPHSNVGRRLHSPVPDPELAPIGGRHRHRIGASRSGGPDIRLFPTDHSSPVIKPGDGCSAKCRPGVFGDRKIDPPFHCMDFFARSEAIAGATETSFRQGVMKHARNFTRSDESLRTKELPAVPACLLQNPLHAPAWNRKAGRSGALHPLRRSTGGCPLGPRPHSTGGPQPRRCAEVRAVR